MKKKSIVRSMNRTKWGGPLKREVRKPVGLSLTLKPVGQSKKMWIGKRKRIDGEEEEHHDQEPDDQESEHSSNEDSDSSSGGFMKVMMKEYMKRKSKKRKGKSVGGGGIKKGIQTEGCRVMADGVVLRTHYDNIGKQPNVVCRVEKFCYLVKKFDPKRRELVESMGFGGLLHLDMKNIPRQFCYWLMSRVFGDGTVVFGDGSIIPLGPNQVRSILGIPMGRKEVPLILGDDEDDTQKIMRVFEQYGVGLKRETVSLNLAAAAMCPEHEDGTLVELETEVDEEDFMVAFLIVALGMIVCTTTNSSNLAASLVPTLVVASAAGEYDWCKFTIDWVRDSADRFQTKFQRDGFCCGCGGSFVFLMIFYLDHLHRVPNRWGVYPRLKVWDYDHLKAVVDEDRRSDEEFGFLPVLDIAYGEDHPLVPRDDGDLELVHSKVANTSVNSMADQVLALLTPRLVSLVEGIVGRALGSSSKASHLDMYTVSMGKGSQPRLSGSSNKGAKKLKAPQEKNPAEQKESCNSSNGEIGDTMTRETAFDKRLETFVKGWKDLKDEKQEGPSIIECDGMNATQRDCYGVVGPRARLGHQYVRMTSILYTKYWGTVEFLNRRKRILIDPSYAMMIKAKEKDYANLARKYCKLLLSIPNDDIRLVFFPVLDGSSENRDEHWWCLFIDLVKNQIWMIDSLYPDPYEQHSELVSELVKAIDVLFQLNDPFWELGTCEKWPKHVVGMVKQTDTFSCGVLMLGCIKHCARNGPDTSYSLEKNLKKRLFLEDANNSCNELLAKFDEILPKDRVRPRRTLSSQNTL